MVTSSQRRRAAGARHVVPVAAACGVLAIGIASAAGGHGRALAVVDRRAGSSTAPAGNTPAAGVRAPAAGVLSLATAIDLSENGVFPLGRVQTVPASEAELSPRSAKAGRSPDDAGAASLSPEAAPSAAAPLPLVLLRPSGGAVTSRFGWRRHPIFGSPEFHTGIDIATRYGSPIVAARAGVVRFVGWKSGYGHIVVLDHGGGLETTYSHLSASLVSPGQKVEEGELIGRIGSSGWSTGPHLFFEVRRNGVPLDPARYLN